MKRRDEVDPDRRLDVCDFCYLGSDRRVLYEDDAVYVMPSLGSFVEGYVLLVSQDHRESVASVVDDEYVAVKRAVGDAVAAEFGDCCFFEHGRVGSCYDRGRNRVCYHAHLHCVPVPDGLVDRVAADFDGKRVDSIRELPALRSANPHYLYVEPHGGDGWFFPVEGGLERQYLRKRACETLDIPVEYADWREHPFRGKMARTADRLGDRLGARYAATPVG